MDGLEGSPLAVGVRPILDLTKRIAAMPEAVGNSLLGDVGESDGDCLIQGGEGSGLKLAQALFDDEPTCLKSHAPFPAAARRYRSEVALPLSCAPNCSSQGSAPPALEDCRLPSYRPDTASRANRSNMLAPSCLPGNCQSDFIMSGFALSRSCV